MTPHDYIPWLGAGFILAAILRVLPLRYAALGFGLIAAAGLRALL